MVSLDPTFLPCGQSTEYGPEIPAQFATKRLPVAVGNGLLPISWADTSASFPANASPRPKALIHFPGPAGRWHQGERDPQHRLHQHPIVRANATVIFQLADAEFLDVLPSAIPQNQSNLDLVRPGEA